MYASTFALLAISVLAINVHSQNADLAIATAAPEPEVAAFSVDPRLGGIRRDLVIEGSQIGGDVIANLLDGSNIRIVGSSIQGSLTLQNGCRVQNDEVLECSGARRRMSAPEQKKMRKRIAQIKKRQRAAMQSKKSGGGKAARKTRAGRRAASRTANKSRPSAKARAAAIRRMNPGYTPCNTCPTDGGDGGDGGDEIPDGGDYGEE